uniref:Uncharacterized protein n=1 Tax=Molossus molossus TaxID=27622 RepID=A0A7J8BJW8_MOLMO|nr:hypothetical protein HJG59_010232 [Molossus molossus]
MSPCSRGGQPPDPFSRLPEDPVFCPISLDFLTCPVMCLFYSGPAPGEARPPSVIPQAAGQTAGRPSQREPCPRTAGCPGGPRGLRKDREGGLGGRSPRFHPLLQSSWQHSLFPGRETEAERRQGPAARRRCQRAFQALPCQPAPRPPPCSPLGSHTCRVREGFTWKRVRSCDLTSWKWLPPTKNLLGREVGHVTKGLKAGPGESWPVAP